VLREMVSDDKSMLASCSKSTESRKMAPIRQASRQMKSDVVHVVYGMVAALFLVLAVGLYSAPTKTTGIAIAFGKNGISIQEKQTE